VGESEGQGVIITVFNGILADALAALVDDRVYPVELPEGPTYPAIVTQLVGALPQADMNGEAGVQMSRIQVDVYGRGYAEVEAIALAVRRLLHVYRTPPGSGDPCQIQGAFCINDFDLSVATSLRAGPRVRRRCLEFNVWNTEV
jgi:hypothetical protein